MTYATRCNCVTLWNKGGERNDECLVFRIDEMPGHSIQTYIYEKTENKRKRMSFYVTCNYT